ncbi:MAG: PKD domain-containing protein [Anaerolineae bacterium]
MSRRSVFTIGLILACALSVTALIFSVTVPASALPHFSPVTDPPAPRFAPFHGLPEEVPANLKAAYSAKPQRPTDAPDVLLFKWTPGNQAHPGGVMVYSVYYANQGLDAAANVIITDVLPAQTTYAGDTSDLPVTNGGGVITWTIGTMPARTEGSFIIVLNVNAAASLGSVLGDNCASISTTTSGDVPDNNQGCAGGVNIVNDSVDVNVQTWPGGFFDAAAGQEYPFTLQVCNSQGTPIGPVRITDTLPLSTTFSRWQPNGFWPTLWRLVSTSGNQVVLETPGFPGYTCDNVQLFVQVNGTVPLGTRLLNQLRSSASGDTQPDNDTARNDAVRVRVPRVDLSTQRRLGTEVFGFEVDIANNGNTAVAAQMTDTLPLSATYRSGSGYWRVAGVWQPITPTVINSRTIVWNFGTLPVGHYSPLHYEVDIAPGATGPLENCGTLAANTPDDTPWNNTACVDATPLSTGAHLQIDQAHTWQNNFSQIEYQLQLVNTGDQVLHDVWLTDTYPLNVSMQGNYNTAATSQITDTWDALNHQRVFWIEQIRPGEAVRIWTYVNPDDVNARPRTYTNTLHIDAPAAATSIDETTLGEFTNIDLRVNSGHLDLWGNAEPGATVRVTTADTSATTAVGQPWDATAWNLYTTGAINAGDTVTVELDGGAQPPIVLHVPSPFVATANSALHQITGQVGALNQSQVELDVYDYFYTTAPTDSSGHFTRTLPAMDRGQQGEVIDRVQDDTLSVAYHVNFASPDLLLTVNPTHDWIELNYAVGHTLWFTITDAVGNVKATLTDVTQVVPWWGGNNNTGYSTNMGTWSPAQPDIEAGDWVYGALDNGFTSTLKVGTITGVIDQPNATVAGAFDVPWFSAALNGACWIDGVDGRIDFTADAIGGAYTCNFSPQVFRPGDTLSVEYEEPTHDRVRYVFRVPGPNVAVNKWAQGQPAAGSRFWYWIEYRNDGDLAATNVTLTDTLPAEVTYVSDNSGVTPTIVGNQLVWSLGTLPPGANRRFPLIVEVAAGTAIGTPLHNVVEVSDPDDRDTGNNTQSRDDNVVALDVDLYAGVWNQGGQPTPGQDYVYHINYGNQGGTGSGPVTLTHTLPVSSTFVEFWSDDPMWSVANTTGNQVVFTRPTIYGWYGTELYVRLHLDAAATVGTQLDTQVDIATTNETGPLNNNSATHTQFVQDPWLNLALDVHFESGITVPDHKVTFRMSDHNWGNLPGQNTRITGTLPAGTTFVTSTRQIFANNQWQQVPLTPLSINGRQVVWDLGTLPTGVDQELRVTLQIDPATPIGTVLTYAARIGSAGDDGDASNDASSDFIVVRGPGPNLMVRKTGYWQDDQRIRYDLQFFNVGTTAVSGVVITETYPVSTTFNNGDLWWNHATTYDAPARQVVWTLQDRLDPGNNGGGWLEVNVDPSIAKGVWLTNTLDISHPIGEITPDDNTAVAVVTTGPDLFVTQAADRATVKPNEVTTFMLHLGNAAGRGIDGTQGNVIVTDTLPAGVTFMGAHWHGCLPCMPSQTLTGQQLVLDLGTLPNNWWSDLDVVVRITNTAQAGDVFVNAAVIASNVAADIDPIVTNNTASAQVLLTNPAFEVSKVRSGNGVAGTTITYTVSVSNMGNLTGTNISAIDVVPSGVTYGGGGLFSSGQVSWTLASLAPGLSNPIGWFTGTLTCAANTPITNQQYRVLASDQGITSTNGAVLSFTTITPTINAAFTQSSAALIGHGTVTFTSTSTTNGTPLTYAWNFGDGGVGTGLNATHTYTQTGAYTVTLTTTDGCGFVQSNVIANAVTVQKYRILLPLVRRS